MNYLNFGNLKPQFINFNCVLRSTGDVRRSLTELSQSPIAINYKVHITYRVHVPVIVIRVRQNSQNLD